MCVGDFFAKKCAMATSPRPGPGMPLAQPGGSGGSRPLVPQSKSSNPGPLQQQQASKQAKFSTDPVPSTSWADPKPPPPPPPLRPDIKTPKILPSTSTSFASTTGSPHKHMDSKSKPSGKLLHLIFYLLLKWHFIVFKVILKNRFFGSNKKKFLK